MEQWEESMAAWLAEEAAQCEERRAALEADGRLDEAVFEKTRANVYGVFRTVLLAAGHTRAQGEEARRFFMERLEQIPKRWSEAYEEGKRHGDIARMALESMKLDTVRKIREKLRQVWERE